MNIEDAKQKVDLIDYVEKTTNSRLKKAGNHYWVNPCPVCGRNDHFTLFIQTNSWRSYNDCTENYAKGGSIVDYFIAVEGYEKQEAIRKTIELAGGDPDNNSKLSEKKEGSKVDNNQQKIQKQEKQSKLPALVQQITAEALQYLQSRGISHSTIIRYRVCSDDRGNILFPFYSLRGEYQLSKHRIPREKQEDEKSKFVNAQGNGRPFFGMQLVDPSRTVVLTEGEIDVLSIYEAGYQAISPPFGINSLEKVIDANWGWIENLQKIVIWADNDEAGQKMVEIMKDKVGSEKLRIVETPHKDPNDALMTEGDAYVARAIKNARQLPVAGIVDAADVEESDPTEWERVQSSLELINKVIGGFKFSDLVLWTGYPGAGKSTLVGQEALYALENNYNVFIYSGELSSSSLLYPIQLQAAGAWNTEEKGDGLGGAYVVPTENAKEQIREWYRGKLKLFEHDSGVGENKLLEVMEMAYRRYNCRVFIVDNMMTFSTGVTETQEKDHYRKQGELTTQLKNFARRYNVIVHLVSHPRKSADGKSVVKNFQQIMGGSEQANLADSIIAVNKYSKEENANEETVDVEALDGLIAIFKDRLLGNDDKVFDVKLDRKSKRFYCATRPEFKSYEFAWEKMKNRQELKQEQITEGPIG